MSPDFYSKFMQSTALLQRVNEITYHHSPRECIYQSGNISLYHYQSKKKSSSIPLLLVFATVNRPEILDIFPDRSLIKNLLEKNQDIYLLDWGYPSQNDKGDSFADYVFSLDACVKKIIKISKQKSINLLGVCQGGVICLSYVSISKSIKNLILISTPVDFHTSDNLVSKLLNKVDIKSITDILGNIPGNWLTDFFISLRPFELVGKKYLRFMENMDDKEFAERFLRVEKWLRDAPDQPGMAFAEFVRDCYQQNRLINGTLKINDQTVTLKNIAIPVLNIMASEDEIVPMSASQSLGKYLSAKDYTAKTFPSGHIGIYVSNKVGTKLATTISKWLQTR